MKVALVQYDILWADPEANRARIRELILAAPAADMYLMPEMLSTGFATSAEAVAESDPPATLELLKELADMRCAAMACSLRVRVADGSIRNRFYFVTPASEQAILLQDGVPGSASAASPGCAGGSAPAVGCSMRQVVTYDKRHLFSAMDEGRSVTAGNRRVVLSWRGFRILPLICYDLRFPVWSRCRNDYDLALYVASWDRARRGVWDKLLRARAIENQCYVCGVNRVGSDESGNFDGGCACVDPWGETVGSCVDDREDVVVCDLDLSVVTKYRASFRAMYDADDFELKV